MESTIGERMDLGFKGLGCECNPSLVLCEAQCL